MKWRFIYLFHWWFTLYPRIYHICDTIENFYFSIVHYLILISLRLCLVNPSCLSTISENYWLLPFACLLNAITLLQEVQWTTCLYSLVSVLTFSKGIVSINYQIIYLYILAVVQFHSIPSFYDCAQICGLGSLFKNEDNLLYIILQLYGVDEIPTVLFTRY